jgi:UDP-N-acetylmuramate dehydrogenase
VGLKGRRSGGAQISEVHANFIVNTGGASADDVLSLVRLARDRVREEHGIELRPEIRFLGSFDLA